MQLRLNASGPVVLQYDTRRLQFLLDYTDEEVRQKVVMPILLLVQEAVARQPGVLFNLITNYGVAVKEPTPEDEVLVESYAVEIFGSNYAVMVLILPSTMGNDSHGFRHWDTVDEIDLDLQEWNKLDFGDRLVIYHTKLSNTFYFFVAEKGAQG